MAKSTKGGRKGGKREKKNVPHGICHIQATFNNTIIKRRGVVRVLCPNPKHKQRQG